MAVQGKLTAKWREHVKTQGLASPDDPNYNARALLQKIKTEKEQLIKDGKIKRQKPLSPISDEEKPFELPKSWEWGRLNNLSNKIHYGFNASAKPEISEVRLLKITDIQNNKVNWSTVPGCHFTEKDLENYLLSENDIVIARTGGTIGKSFLVKELPVKSLFASYLIKIVPNKFIFAQYIKKFIESPCYWNQLYEYAWGAAQPNVNGTKLSSLVTVLPPLAEQQAIVSQVEKLFTQIDQLHALAQKRLNYQEKSAKALFSKVNHAGNDTELEETWQTLTAHFHSLTQKGYRWN